MGGGGFGTDKSQSSARAGIKINSRHFPTHLKAVIVRWSWLPLATRVIMVIGGLDSCVHTATSGLVVLLVLLLLLVDGWVGWGEERRGGVFCV